MHQGMKKHLIHGVAALLGLGLFAFTGIMTAGIAAERLLSASATATGIVVSGEGTAKVAPDRAEITLGLEARGETAAEAQRQNAEKMELIIAALTEAGVAREDIKTADYNLTPVRHWDEQTRREILSGYQASNLVTISTKQTGEVGRLVDLAVAAGANHVQSISFEVEDEATVRAEALNRAVADARRKAEQMARTAGVRLGKVKSLTDSTSEYRPFMQAEKLMAADLSGDRRAETPIEPGQVRFRTTAQMTFAIR